MTTTVCNDTAVDSMLTQETFALAYSLWTEGFSVIPLLADSKRPARKWKQYQTARCTLADLREWFIDHDYIPGIVTGELSGITIIDCDDANAVQVASQHYLSRVKQRTTRGLHLAFKFNGERNTTRLHGAKIDRRGEGGYVRAYADSATWTRAAVELLPRLRAEDFTAPTPAKVRSSSRAPTYDDCVWPSTIPVW